MVGWHHRLSGREFEQALGVGGGQGGLACCGPWGRQESDTNHSRELRSHRWLGVAKKKCVLRFTLHFPVDNFKILLKLSKEKK